LLTTEHTVAILIFTDLFRIHASTQHEIALPAPAVFCYMEYGTGRDVKKNV
jgi:hypothetical protein